MVSTQEECLFDWLLLICTACSFIKGNTFVRSNASETYLQAVYSICKSSCQRQLLKISQNRAFSLTWPAAMEIYWNKRKCLHKKRVQFPQDWFGTATWPPFHFLGTPIWLPLSHVKTLYNAFSFMWPAALYKRYLHKKRVQHPLDWLTRSPFHYFGTPIWLPWHQFIWKHSIWLMILGITVKDSEKSKYNGKW